MLNEIIKTAEELNTAALYYRQSGNMDGVRELAKAHAVSKKQTEEFIQGSRYRLVDIPIEERKFANASEKLRAEMFALKDAGFADIIGQYLVNLAKTDSALDAQVLKKHKMLQRCLDYVTQKAYNIALEEAKKKGENGIRANTGLALSDDQVFPWVLEYYAKDDEKEIAEKEQEEKKYPFELRFYESSPLAVEDLLNGRIQAALMDELPANNAIENGRAVKKAGTHGEPDQFGVAMRKEDKELQKLVNEGYKKLMADPYWKELQQKYLSK